MFGCFMFYSSQNGLNMIDRLTKEHYTFYVVFSVFKIKGTSHIKLN